MTWNRIAMPFALAVHARQIAEHGGLEGVRDAGAVESALARPQNLASYGHPDVSALAAAYGFGVTRNHGFADGNRRTAWVVMRTFLIDNGYGLAFDQAEAVLVVERLAAGEIDEDTVARWLRERLTAKEQA